MLAVSGVLNALLLAWVGWMLLAAPPSRDPTQAGDRAPVVVHPGTRVLPPAKGLPASTDFEPPVQWAAIESPDYVQYVANLRAIGCPEALVRDIITADLTEVFSRRARAIWSPARRAYWEKPASGDRPNARELAQLQALAREQAEASRRILGTSVRQQELIDLVGLQLWGPTRQLAGLPEARRQAANEALLAAGYYEELEAIQLEPGGRNRPQREAALEEKRLQALAAVLSPEELREQRFRNSSQAANARQMLGRFEATEEEFQTLMEVSTRLSADPKASTGDPYRRKAAEVEQVRAALGEARAAEFERTSDLFYVWASTAAERYGLSEGAVAEAWQAKHDAMARARALQQQAGLDGAARSQELRELHRQATSRIDAALGPDASRFAQAGDGAWLQILAGGGVP